MDKSSRTGILSNVSGDLSAGLVVFFVAVPLCLGIALASGAPLFSGVVAGMVGGVIVGIVSKSNLSVSGPAAGLTAIVLVAITDLGAFNIFLCAVIAAGAIQLLLGFLKAGSVANYFPSNVIEGMLAAIGIIIILKQIPHAIGFDRNYEGDFYFIQPAGDNTFSAIYEAFTLITPGAVIIAVASLVILLIWERVDFLKKVKLLPGPFVVVVVGVILNEIFIAVGSTLAIEKEHLVSLPVVGSVGEFFGQFVLPDFSGFANSRVWVHGGTLAIVASIETLLCIEATDRLDPLKRYTPTNHELKAQGIGNMISGLIGGLPITSVIVRSSTNINANARTKLSCITHGVLMTVCVALIPFLLNKIPLSALAVILIFTGFKLAKPSIFRKMWANGKYQFIPFIVTIVAIVFTDLLKGVALGMILSIFIILRENLKSAYFFRRKEYAEGNTIHIRLAQEVSFLNKAAIKMTLEQMPQDSHVVIDASYTVYIDHDVLELIKQFKETQAPERGIQVELIGFTKEYDLDNTLRPQLVYSEDSQSGEPTSKSSGKDQRELTADPVKEGTGKAAGK